jgi:hypothetical protein
MQMSDFRIWLLLICFSLQGCSLISRIQAVDRTNAVVRFKENNDLSCYSTPNTFVCTSGINDLHPISSATTENLTEKY